MAAFGLSTVTGAIAVLSLAGAVVTVLFRVEPSQQLSKPSSAVLPGMSIAPPGHATVTRGLEAECVRKSGWFLMLALIGFASAIGLGATALSLAMSADRAPTRARVKSRRE